MDIQQFINTIAISTVIYGAFIALIVLFSGKGKDRRGRFFIALALISLSLLNLEGYLRESTDFMHHIPRLFNITLPFLYAIGPSWYCFIRIHIDREVQTRRLLPHFSLFAGVLLYFVYHALTTSTIQAETALNNYYNGTAQLPIRGISVLSIINTFLVASHYLFSFYIVIRHRIKKRRKLKSSYRFEINWAEYVTMIFLVILVMWALQIFFDPMIVQVVMYMSLLVLISPFTFYNYIAVKTPFSYKNVVSHRKAADNIARFRNGRDEQELISRLMNLLHRDQLHLDPELTVERAAKLLDVPKYFLSRTVLQVMHCSFSELLTKYRIDSAKNKLQDNDQQDKNILEIALDSGFNSKPTFNRLFKQHTGVSPREYRERNREHLEQKEA